MPSAPPQLQFVSDSSILIRFQGDPSVQLSQQVLSVFEFLKNASTQSGQITNLHPAYDSLLLDFLSDSPRALLAELQQHLNSMALAPTKAPRPLVKILVQYGGENGPDLEAVARFASLSPEQVIRAHAEVTYTVAFLGFAPGFPYLLGLPLELQMPRKPQPRLRIPAGSVALGGNQTGIYPSESPAGWQWIGRTESALFEPSRSTPSLLNPGDQVQFCPAETGDLFGNFTQDLQSPKQTVKKSADANSAKPLFEVEVGGFFSTIQDNGRPGLAHLGVSCGGAADVVAYKIGNSLVGNSQQAASLEMTLLGASLIFKTDTWVAITGSPCDATLDELPIAMWTSIPVCAGQRLATGAIHRGLRSYISFHGGLGTDWVLGSRSTLVAAGWGGFEGRRLETGDVLTVAADAALAPAFRCAPEAPAKLYGGTAKTLRVTRGPQADWFTQESFDLFLQTEFQVTNETNRLGIRLQHCKNQKIAYADAYQGKELVSEGIANGSVQIPAGGQPMILFCEQQTTGGYPKIATVICADWHRLGQLKPGDHVRFAECTLEMAWQQNRDLQTGLTTLLQDF